MTTQTAGAEPLIDDARAKKNVLVLATAQAFGGAGPPINMAIAALAAHHLLGEDKSLATFPITTFVLGTACGAFPAALLMRRVGRRAGFIAGLLIGAIGGLIEAAAIAVHSFWLLAFGAFLVGVTNAFVHQFRFAAADISSVAFRPKAIAWVLAGGLFAALIGPQSAILTRDMMDPIPFAGAFVSASVFAIVAAFVLTLLDIPKPPAPEKGKAGRPLREIAGQKDFILAVLCAICAYALMNLVMTAAPLAMVGSGHHVDTAVRGIQWHVVAMFAPSFFTGSLIARFGAERIVAVGMILLIGCASVALSGTSVGHYWFALVLLGVGWNFGFIGGTTLVTATYRPEEKERVQALNDFLVFGFVALASLSSGYFLVLGGWNLVNLAVYPIALLCLSALGLLALKRRRGLG